MIPDYSSVVIDEAHELTARVTQAATDELAVPDVERARPVARSGSWTGTRPTTSPTRPTRWRDAMADCAPGRIDAVPEELGDALVLVRDAARACLSAYPRESDASDADAGPHPGPRAGAGGVRDHRADGRRLEADVLWLAEGGERIPPRLCVAPLQVWGPMRDKLLTDKTVVFTSAT